MSEARAESLELLFTGELAQALHEERVELSAPAQQYVVRLLSDVQRDHLRYPLAPRYLKAVQRGQGRVHDVALRGVGDTALMLSGWWWRWTESNRHGPGVAYHVDLGWSAYRLIDGEPYDELSERFTRLVDVLAQMTVRVRESGDRTLLTSLDDETLYDLYDFYCRTSSRQAARLLKKNGFDVQEAETPQ